MGNKFGFGGGMGMNARHFVRPAVPDPPELSDRLWYGFMGGTAWDVGSNCGQAILEMSWAFDKIIGFEPDPRSHSYAVDYVRTMLPGFDITVHRIAMSDSDGTIELAYPAKEQKETGQLVTIGTQGMEWEPKNWDKVERLRVESWTADKFAGHHGGYPDFAKIDTEGHEAAVLRGAEGLLACGKTDILLEFHTPGNHDFCEKALLDAGYKVTTVRHPHYEPDSHMYFQHGWIRAFAPNK